MTIRPAAVAASLLFAHAVSTASAQAPTTQSAKPTSAPTDFYRNDAGRTGYTPTAMPTPLSLSWRHTAVYVKNSPASPVAANGLIYFAAGPSVYAVSAADGSTKWQFPVDGKSGNFLITPAVADGFLYVGNDSGQVYKIDAATGAQVWTKTVGGAVRSSPVIDNGMVIFGCADRQCYALSTGTGQTVWAAPTNGSITTPPIVAGEQIVVASSDSNLYSLNATTGKENWNEQLPGDPTAAPVIFGDGMLYVAGGSSILALGGRNGATRWNYTLDAEVSTPPTYGAGSVYIGTQDGKFYALNGRGHVRWSTTLAEPSYGAPLLAGDTILVPTQRGILYALDTQTGHLKWQYVVQAVGTATQPKYGETDITSAPIWTDGALYVLSNDGTLSAFRADAVDQAVPTLSALSPNPGSVVAGVRVPYGATVVDEGCGIDPSGVSLQVDHAPVALAKYNPSRNSIAVDLSGDTRGDANRPLADGVHQITLRAQDWRGNAVTRSWTFTVNNKLNPVVRAPIGVAGEDELPATPDDTGAGPVPAALPGSNNNAAVSATPPRGPNGRDPDGGVNGGPPPPPPIDVPIAPGGGAPVPPSPTPPSPTPVPPTAPGAPPPP